MVRYRPPETSESIKNLSEELDSYNYHSVLFTVHSMLGDMWTKISNAINKSHKFKYMIAFRPYLFSPQYLAMLISSFNQISNNRLMLNLVHGTIGKKENFDGIIWDKDSLFDDKNRRNYAKEFINKFFNKVKMFEPFEMPEILVSGHSDDSIELAKNTSNIIALFYESFMENPQKFSSMGFKKIFVFLSVLIAETDEDAEREVNSIPEENRTVNGSPIYGSKQTLTQKFLELERLGVTDILFSQFDQSHDPKEIHEFLAELTRDGILS